MSELKVRITGDNSSFDAALTTAKAKANAFSNSMSAKFNAVFGSGLAALISTAAIGKLTRDTIDFGSQLNDISDATRINVEWLQKLRYTAIQAGSGAEDLNKFLLEVVKNREEAFKNPKSNQRAAFQRMGFSIPEINDVPMQQFIERIIKNFQTGASGQLDADVMAIGGKSAKKLLVTFAQGIDENAPVISEDLVNSLDDIDDAFARLHTTLMVDIAPAIIAATNGIKSFAGWIGTVGAFFGGLSAGRDKVNERTAKAYGTSEERMKYIGPILGMPLFRAAKEFYSQQTIDDLFGTSGQSILDKEAVDKSTDLKIQFASRLRKANRREREKGGMGFNDDFNPEDSTLKARAKTETDSLSKVGLFTTGAILFNNPLLDVAKESLKVQRQIAVNTSPQRDQYGDQFM